MLYGIILKNSNRRSDILIFLLCVHLEPQGVCFGLQINKYIKETVPCIICVCGCRRSARASGMTVFFTSTEAAYLTLWEQQLDASSYRSLRHFCSLRQLQWCTQLQCKHQGSKHGGEQRTKFVVLESGDKIFCI